MYAIRIQQNHLRAAAISYKYKTKYLEVFSFLEVEQQQKQSPCFDFIKYTGWGLPLTLKTLNGRFPKQYKKCNAAGKVEKVETVRWSKAGAPEQDYKFHGCQEDQEACPLSVRVVEEAEVHPLVKVPCWGPLAHPIRLDAIDCDDALNVQNKRNERYLQKQCEGY